MKSTIILGLAALCLLVTSGLKAGQSEDPARRFSDLVYDEYLNYRSPSELFEDSNWLFSQAARDAYQNNSSDRSEDILSFSGSSAWIGTLDLEISDSIIVELNINGIRLFESDDLESPLSRIPLLFGIDYDQAFLQDSILYVGRRNKLHIFDISDPIKPAELSVIDVGYNFMEIHVEGNRLYLGAIRYHRDWNSHPILSIYNIANSYSPFLLGEYDTLSGITDFRRFDIKGNTAYGISHENNRLIAISIEDPENPELIACVPTIQQAWDIEIYDNFIYVMGDYGIWLYRIEDPNEIVLVTTYYMLYENWSIKAHNGRLFHNRTENMKVYTISDSGYLEFEAYCPHRTSWFNFIVNDSLIYSPEYGHGFSITDITDINNAYISQKYTSPAWNLYGVDPEDNWVYCSNGISPADFCDQLLAIDATDKSNPIYENSVPSSTNSVRVLAEQERIFVAGSGQGLFIYDRTTPDSPELLTNLTDPPFVEHVSLKDDYGFVSSGYFGLNIYDFSNPGNPVQVSQIPNTYLPMVSYVDGDILYLLESQYIGPGLDFPHYLRIVDISDIYQPLELSLLEIGYFLPITYEIQKHNDYIYWAAGDSGLVVIDVQDPASPEHVASHIPLNYTNQNHNPICCYLAIKNPYLFLSVTSAYYLEVLDISNPANPELVQSIPFPHFVNDVEIQDDYLYAACAVGMYIYEGDFSRECGDANADYNVNISDAVSIVNYVFVGGNPPDPYDIGDVNCDSSVNVSDAVSIINFVFIGGYSPCDPDNDGVPDC
ncbi:MAG: hypothetical protein GWO41_02785 [candidate division Zixibacteria bacterium]|nr:hypothetical protein [candidate division Zixibacteria bacterium]NIR63608.1 hypothetical protein [candidate division Zixibacteria bacterium]NIS15191.1 hypothetical protein [candidate division Zixibacteria bacterium]NIS45576.1 hypothetical protein [candidate division Zixibacteria bacterium]NIT51689.1 hypothetical protein [candidate division Zixibacteria bacterium]